MFKKAFSQALDRAVTRAGSGGKLHAHGSGTDIPGTPDAPSYHTGHIQPWHDDGGTPVNARSSDDIIAELFNRYFEAEFEPLQHELGALPDNVNETLLESLVEGRTLELEVCRGGEVRVCYTHTHTHTQLTNHPPLCHPHHALPSATTHTHLPCPTPRTHHRQ